MFLGGGSGAGAADIAAVYGASWAGLPAADIKITFGETGPRYRAEIDIRTEGPARWFTNFRCNAVSEGRFDAGGAAAPMSYDARYTLRKRSDRRISQRFVERDGARITDRGPDDTSGKPPLPEIYRRNVVDPLTALVFMRQALRTGSRSPGRRIIVPVYDGARRFDVEGQVVASEHGRRDRRIHLVLSLRPIAGFKGETSEDGDPDDAPRRVDIEFTDDEALLPVSVRVPIAFLPLFVRLDHRCSGNAACGS